MEMNTSPDGFYINIDDYLSGLHFHVDGASAEEAKRRNQQFADIRAGDNDVKAAFAMGMAYEAQETARMAAKEGDHNIAAEKRETALRWSRAADLLLKKK